MKDSFTTRAAQSGAATAATKPSLPVHSIREIVAAYERQQQLAAARKRP